MVEGEIRFGRFRLDLARLSLAGSLAVGVRLLSLVGDYAALDESTKRPIVVTTEQGFPF